jgi:hypothetical protein
LNWFLIFKYTLILLVAQIAISTITTILIGFDNLMAQSANFISIFQNLPIIFVNLVVLSIYAKNQLNKTLIHLSLTVLFSMLLSLFITSIIIGQLFISPAWLIGVVISVFSVLVATFVGTQIRGVSKNAI